MVLPPQGLFARLPVRVACRCALGHVDGQLLMSLSLLADYRSYFKKKMKQLSLIQVENHGTYF